MDKSLLVSEQDGILLLTINRPHARNAIDLETARCIAAAMDLLDARDDLRAGVITGVGSTFSAGADLKGIARGERAIVPGRGFAGLVEAPPSKPLIAAVEGYALGGGCEIALVCDLIVAGAGARFGLPEVKRGLLANAGGLLRLPRQLPYRLAMEMVLLGEPLEAEAAHRLRLINRVVPAGGALAEAMIMARQLTANGPLAVLATKRIVQESGAWSLKEAFSRQAEISEPVFQSADAREGATAFAEKRAPVWQAR